MNANFTPNAGTKDVRRHFLHAEGLLSFISMHDFPNAVSYSCPKFSTVSVFVISKVK
jgi:hypothetical protein